MLSDSLRHSPVTGASKLKRIAWRPGCWLDPSGCLWLDEGRVLVVADAHLGYSLAQRRRGDLGPKVDALGVERLERVVARCEPERIVFLGDLVHAPRPSNEEHRLIQGLLERLSSQSRLIVVRGNHDRRMVMDFAGAPAEFLPEWRYEDLTFLHGDLLPEGEGVFVLGHLHPVFRFEDAAGARQRVPVFVAGVRGLLLPAMAPFSAGYELDRGFPPGWDRFFAGSVEIWAAAENTVIQLGRWTVSRGRLRGQLQKD